LREFLSKSAAKYRIDYREDIHYSIIEFGGANAKHFSFAPNGDDLRSRIRVAKICSNSMAILDGDNEGKPRTKILANELGPGLVILDGKEVEHLLPLALLRAYAQSIDMTLNVTLLELEDYHRSRDPLGCILDRRLDVSIFTDGQTIKNKMGLHAFGVA
jgi:hypothetical protein